MLKVRGNSTTGEGAVGSLGYTRASEGKAGGRQYWFCVTDVLSYGAAGTSEAAIHGPCVALRAPRDPGGTGNTSHVNVSTYGVTFLVLLC